MGTLNTAEDVEKAIRQILWGRSYLSVKNAADEPHDFLMRLLSTVEQAQADMIRNQNLEKSKNLGIITEMELLGVLTERGLWSDADDKAIRQFRKQAKLEREDSNTIFRYDKHNRMRAQKRAKKYELASNRIEERKLSMLAASAEQMADLERMLWIIQKVTYKDDDALVWPSPTDMRQETDRILLTRLMNRYNETLFDMTDLRRMARSPQWRFRWNASKTDITGLFGVSFRDLDLNQDMLVYWSQVYDSAFEAMEQPDSMTLENDEAFDQWLKNQAKERRSSSKNSKSDVFGKRNKSSKAITREEMFIMAKDKDSAREIQEMNPESTRRRINQDMQKTIKEGGVASEGKIRFGKRR